MERFDAVGYVSLARRLYQDKEIKLGGARSSIEESLLLADEAKSFLEESVPIAIFIQALLGIERPPTDAVINECLAWFGYNIMRLDAFTKRGVAVKKLQNPRLFHLEEGEKTEVFEFLAAQYQQMCMKLAELGIKKPKNLFHSALVAVQPPEIVDRLRKAYPNASPSKIGEALRTNPRNPMEAPDLRR